MRVAVTGADGFTGRYLLPELVRRGHEAMALDADITDGSAVEAAVAAMNPEAVIHLAGLAFIDRDDFAGFYGVNQLGSFNLLNALARRHPGAHVILASTAQVYGAGATGLIDEEAPLRPSNHYALSKTAMEMGARLWTEKLRITIVRPFNYTGVGQELRYLIPKIVDHFKRGEATIRLGNVDVRRDWGDVRAVSTAYAALLEATAPASGAPATYNVATGAVESVRGVVARLSALLGRSMAITVDPALVRAGDVPVLGGRCDRLRKAAPGWAPHSLDDTLAWMLDAS